MTTQYLRQLSCVVANEAGEGIEFGNFHVQFQTRRGDFQTPNSCDVRIFNLAPATANKISGLEFTQLQVSVGYAGTGGVPSAPILIFRGTIKQFRKGRVNQLDSYVDITAADGDEAYNFAPVFVSVPASNSQSGIQAALLQAMQPYGVTQGYLPNLPQSGLVRGRVLFGMCRDEYRDFAWTNNCKWSIQDGASTLIPYTSYVATGTAIPIISVSTGLIGVPEQTQQGITIKTLMNPAFKVGQLVQLTAGVNTFRRSLDINAQSDNQALALQVQTSADGLYYVMTANHTGDTRGQSWYTDLTCLSVDSTITQEDTLSVLVAQSAGSISRYGQ